MFKHSASSLQLISEVAGLSSNPTVCRLAEAYGMKVVNVAWEDTSRAKGSCWGDNISDMTLMVCDPNSRAKIGRPMPIIRKPNFADITSDHDIDGFNVTVGNELAAKSATTIPLKTYLENIATYTGNKNLKSLYAERDAKILVSAQACVLPLADGAVEFNVQLYNYNNHIGADPRVLVVVASSEGTSARVVRGTTSLYFQKSDMCANFVAERLSDDRRRRGVPIEGAMTSEEKTRHALLIFQIPLKKVALPKRSYTDSRCCGSYTGCSAASASVTGLSYYGKTSMKCVAKAEEEEEVGGAGGLFGDDDDWDGPIAESAPVAKSVQAIPEPKSRGFENAVLRTTDGFGTYTGTENLTFVRDNSYPIRCTIQYYAVTDNSVITDAMMTELSDKVNRAYNVADVKDKGSLVLGTIPGSRVTESVSTQSTQSTQSTPSSLPSDAGKPLFSGMW